MIGHVVRVTVFAVGVFIAMSPVALAADEKIDGTWQVTSAEVKGKTYPAPKGSDDTWTFDQDKLVRKAKGKVEMEGTFKLDAKQTPAHLDLIAKSDGKEMMVTKCIYKFTTDGLQVAVPFDQANGERPTGFDSQKAIITNFKRVKP
jgi:uncharacterized protein (TIGR03067 family)